MWISFVILMLVILSYYGYGTYLKEYFEVKRVYQTLQKVLDTRDLLLLKLASEKIDKKKIAEIVMLIDKRKETRNSGYTVRMKADVELSNHLKSFYEEISKVLDNDLAKDVFLKTLEMEKQAKKIRLRYNDAVEKYNQNLVLHKKMCMRFLRMKPLDKYEMH